VSASVVGKHLPQSDKPQENETKKEDEDEKKEDEERVVAEKILQLSDKSLPSGTVTKQVMCYLDLFCRRLGNKKGIADKTFARIIQPTSESLGLLLQIASGLLDRARSQAQTSGGVLLEDSQTLLAALRVLRACTKFRLDGAEKKADRPAEDKGKEKGEEKEREKEKPLTDTEDASNGDVPVSIYVDSEKDAHTLSSLRLLLWDIIEARALLPSSSSEKATEPSDSNIPVEEVLRLIQRESAEFYSEALHALHPTFASQIDILQQLIATPPAKDEEWHARGLLLQALVIRIEKDMWLVFPAEQKDGDKAATPAEFPPVQCFSRLAESLLDVLSMETESLLKCGAQSPGFPLKSDTSPALRLLGSLVRNACQIAFFNEPAGGEDNNDNPAPPAPRDKPNLPAAEIFQALCKAILGRSSKLLQAVVIPALTPPPPAPEKEKGKEKEEAPVPPTTTTPAPSLLAPAVETPTITAMTPPSTLLETYVLKLTWPLIGTLWGLVGKHLPLANAIAPLLLPLADAIEKLVKIYPIIDNLERTFVAVTLNHIHEDWNIKQAPWLFDIQKSLACLSVMVPYIHIIMTTF